jgi:hypothetical protein
MLVECPTPSSIIKKIFKKTKIIRKTGNMLRKMLKNHRKKEKFFFALKHFQIS